MNDNDRNPTTLVTDASAVTPIPLTKGNSLKGMVEEVRAFQAAKPGAYAELIAQAQTSGKRFGRYLLLSQLYQGLKTEPTRPHMAEVETTLLNHYVKSNGDEARQAMNGFVEACQNAIRSYCDDLARDETHADRAEAAVAQLATYFTEHQLASCSAAISADSFVNRFIPKSVRGQFGQGKLLLERVRASAGEQARDMLDSRIAADDPTVIRLADHRRRFNPAGAAR